MINAELIKTVSELQELKRMRDDLDAEIAAAEMLIKNEMSDAETITAGPFRIDYKPVTSARIDTTALKRELPEIAARYTKTTTVKRFTSH